jgi:hypothetical protein
MMRFASNFNQLGRVMSKMLEDKGEKVIEEVDIALRLVSEDILTEATILAPVYQSGLVQSLDVYKVDENNYLVGSYLVYAAAIEYGGPPRKIPMEPLREWARHRGIEEFTFQIWLSIMHNGTKAQPFLRPAWFKYERDIQGRVESAIHRGLENG